MTHKIKDNLPSAQNQEKPKRSQLYIFIASTISCTFTMTVCNPLEVAKLKYQYSPVGCPQYPHPSFK